MNIEDIQEKKVLLKLDLGRPNRSQHLLYSALESAKMLLENGNTVCLVIAYGPAFLKPGLTTKKLLKFVEERLGRGVVWVDNVDNIRFRKNKMYLMENILLDRRELDCDEGFIDLLKRRFDVMVLDSIMNIDANFASSQGLIRAEMPIVYGLALRKLIEVRDLLWRSKVGIILGGSNVACQLRFISAMISQINFVAAGGQTGLLMMGKGSTMYSAIKDRLLSTMALLRKHKIKVYYPVDVVAYSPESQRNRLTMYQDLEESELVHDLGCGSVSRMLKSMDETDLDVVVLAGTIGHVLDPRYSRGTESLLKSLAKRSITKVILGHRAIEVAERVSVVDKFQYVLNEDSMNVRFLVQPKSMEDYIEEVVWNVESISEGVL